MKDEYKKQVFEKLHKTPKPKCTIGYGKGGNTYEYNPNKLLKERNTFEIGGDEKTPKCTFEFEIDLPKPKEQKLEELV